LEANLLVGSKWAKMPNPKPAFIISDPMLLLNKGEDVSAVSWNYHDGVTILAGSSKG